MNSFSVTGKEWIFKKFDNENVNFLKENFSLDEITSKLLDIRKIGRDDVKNFLNPLIKNNLPNPNSLKDMDKTVKRVIKTINKKEKIGIFGDYDVDGATSSALLGKYFEEINQSYKIYIPDRTKEGYGPSEKGFKSLIDSKIGIIFTVDCGTLSYEPINFAKSKNIDVIVFDHHQSEIKLPNAFSIINPNRIDDNSKLNYLCAAGVCFMFLIALNKELRKINWFNDKKIKEPDLLKYLDLVSLGTVCDVVPLKFLNRALVNQGLKVLNLKKNLGLKTLLDICKIENTPTTYHLGYVIGPRINAGGRVGKCFHGTNLLLNINPQETFKLANELDAYNKERQFLEKDLLNIISNKIEKKIKDPVIILSGKNWHEGIIGIIAARIKEKYNKPTIIISEKNEIGKASARSIIGFDIGSVILSAVKENILLKGGGHKMAGGFSINMKFLDKFKEYVFKKFKKIDSTLLNKKIIYIDSHISSSALNLEFYDQVNKLAPFGSGNPEPRFIIEKLRTVNSKIVGEKHIKSILLAGNGITISSIAFNAVDSELGGYLLKNNKKNFDIVGKISLNEWKGKKNVEFIIDDISVNKNNKNTVPSSIG